MKAADRWLLPDGIEEVLPSTAIQIERLRRELLDLYHSWGYDLVIPPLLEFTDSLLSGSGSDLDLLTFKVTDQLSGRTMGVRADITPQTARMDAHSLRRNGPCRLCYAGHVLYTRPRSALESRSPLQVGVEFYGESGLGADIEVIGLMIESLETAGLERPHLEMGHVGIYRSLLEMAELDGEREAELFTLLQAKALAEIDPWLAEHVSDDVVRGMLARLPMLNGPTEVLERAREELAEAPAELHAALDELEYVSNVVRERAPEVGLYFDLSELRGYHYHTGIVFAAFAPGLGRSLGNGGRYDHIGEAFGRARPATGFALDLSVLAELANWASDEQPAIYARDDGDPGLWGEVERLRACGERVVCGFSDQEDPGELNCDRVLAREGDVYRIQPVNSQ